MNSQFLFFLLVAEVNSSSQMDGNRNSFADLDILQKCKDA